MIGPAAQYQALNWFTCKLNCENELNKLCFNLALKTSWRKLDESLWVPNAFQSLRPAEEKALSP